MSFGIIVGVVCGIALGYLFTLICAEMESKHD